MLFDLIAAHHNEGISREMFRKYLPKTACREFDEMLDKFGHEIYRAALWDERAKASTPIPDRCRIDWPIKRISNIIPLRRRQTIAPEPITLGGGFWSL